MVKDVEEIRPERNVETFPDGLVPDEGCIEVDPIRIAKTGLDKRIVRYGERRSDRERARVKPTVRSALIAGQHGVLQAVAASDIQGEIGEAGVVGRSDTERDSPL